MRQQQDGAQWKLLYLSIDADHLDVLGSEAVYLGDRIVGLVMSGGYGHTVSRNLAFAYVETQFASEEAQLEVEMLGDRYSVSVLEAAVYDPDNERMRC